MDENTSGTTYVRKLRGWKLQFVCGGPSLKDCVRVINWQHVYANNLCVVWASQGRAFVVKENGERIETTVDPRNFKE